MFKWGNFTSNAGLTLPFKIELDELPNEDWDCLARIVAYEWSFGRVEGVPTGGLRFAEALEKYIEPGHSTLLIVDDVLTTGGSMEQQRAGRRAFGVVVFSRMLYPPRWVSPLFQLQPLYVND